MRVPQPCRLMHHTEGRVCTVVPVIHKRMPLNGACSAATAVTLALVFAAQSATADDGDSVDIVAADLVSGDAVPDVNSDDRGVDVGGGRKFGNRRLLDGLGKDAESSPTLGCPVGYQQVSPVALRCEGGDGQSKLVLSPSGTQDDHVTWEAPAGTENLNTRAVFWPTGSVGINVVRASVALTVQCLSSKHVAVNRSIIDAQSGLLNASTRATSIGGALWSWTGEPAEADEHGLYQIGFRVIGSLYCDVLVTLSNKRASHVNGILDYSSTGLSRCPNTPPGCGLCPQNVCNSSEHTVCDGSKFWKCGELADSTIQAKRKQLGLKMVGATAADVWLPGPRSRNQLEVSLFRALDSDGDGKIGEAEFYRLIALQAAAPPQNSSVWKRVYAQTVAMFNIPDEGANLTMFERVMEGGFRAGEWNFFRLVHWIAVLLEHEDRDVIADSIFDGADRDRDGILDYEEFTRVCLAAGISCPSEEKWNESLGGHSASKVGILRKYFDAFMAQNEQVLTIFALTTVLSKLVDEDPHSKVVRQLFERLDVNQDSILDKAELKRFTATVSSTIDIHEVAQDPVALALLSAVASGFGSYGVFDRATFSRLLLADADFFNFSRLKLIEASLDGSASTTKDGFDVKVENFLRKFGTSLGPRTKSFSTSAASTSAAFATVATTITSTTAAWTGAVAAALATTSKWPHASTKTPLSSDDVGWYLPSWQNALGVLAICATAVLGAGAAAGLCLFLAWRSAHQHDRVGLREDRVRLERSFDRAPHNEDSEALLAESMRQRGGVTGGGSGGNSGNISETVPSGRTAGSFSGRPGRSVEHEPLTSVESNNRQTVTNDRFSEAAARHPFTGGSDGNDGL
eukprot:TRINITY_DN33502_c0_g1_i1.p1 TRINITY_DN33502_c0_g1~~TRINITY_DN33502_c0_g1_i1.p1  ORF type:complete len:856 (+),score=116.37 TRINITY_DN33502_c0_g1_i1:38-2605(+)